MGVGQTQIVPIGTDLDSTGLGTELIAPHVLGLHSPLRRRSYYTGHTEDLENRVAEHQHGSFPGYAHDRRPVELVWSQDFGTRIEAPEAERKIKGWARGERRKP